MNSLLPPANAPSADLGGDLREKVWVLWGRVSIAAVGAHVAFFAVFVALGLPVLAWVNAGSIAIHLSCYLLFSRRRHLQGIVLLLSEVLVHAAIATRLLGLDSGFQFYILTLVLPLLVTLTGSVARKLLCIAAIGVFYAVLDAWTHGTVPIYTVSAPVLDGLRYFNLGGLLVIMAFVALTYAALVTNAETVLRNLACTDPLTGLQNRRQMLHVARRERADAAHGVCVLLCDVDHFKRVNDNHGHEVGDRALYHVGRALSGSLRKQDSVARWGGEEFLVLVVDADLGTAVQAAERMCRAVADTRIELPDASAFSVTLTIGVARLRSDEPIDAAIARADAALYRGKTAGRNRVSIETDPTRPAGAEPPPPGAAPGDPVGQFVERPAT